MRQGNVVKRVHAFKLQQTLSQSSSASKGSKGNLQASIFTSKHAFMTHYREGLRKPDSYLPAIRRRTLLLSLKHEISSDLKFTFEKHLRSYSFSPKEAFATKND